MWVLLGVSDNTIENETFVYFIGIFDNLNLAAQERDKIAKESNSSKSNFIIKSVYTNKSYSYDWSNNDEDEIKNI